MTIRSILPASWQVPQEFHNRLGTGVGRQRAMQFEGHLLLVLHQPPRPDDPVRIGRYFWRKPEGAWNSSDLGSGPEGLRKHLAQFAKVLEDLDQREEKAASADEYFAVMEAIAPVHRCLRHLYQVLEEARRACPQDRDLIDFRDRAYELDRAAELLQVEVKNSLDLTVARRAEEQARAGHSMAAAGHRLNLLAAFFFPIATLSAIFGANLRHGFEQVPAPGAFLAVMASGLALGALLMKFVARVPAGIEARNARPAKTGKRR